MVVSDEVSGMNRPEGLEIKAAVISWRSNKHRRVLRSTFSAELLSATTAFDEASWTTMLFQEIVTGGQVEDRKVPIDIRTDCASLVDSTRSLRIQATEKRLYNEIWTLREALESGELRSLEFVESSMMVADGLTKVQPKLRYGLVACMKGILRIPFAEKKK
jgi:hypothetical protein